MFNLSAKFSLIELKKKDYVNMRTEVPIKLKAEIEKVI